ncbi:hypothetical protein BG74_04340 [Sodalis-like endosymbiont of Proechinophthirus fluctus]|uniref:flagellar biosynthetic protein FliO n=1 Tax=Sodalis-like endosymbiont of Proechinophthirus fluctus TaxID=1462730 RepID=UPI0007A82729|nr:flagellar biosynthetic protein FliO [Sodalis-like endosymbiont of Proechinophthirus fluctus]KYP97212.1 hypothetical protein BG74_04340 [Sodalis-like endosymbiont of Proechinophthirus fluctus]
MKQTTLQLPSAYDSGHDAALLNMAGSLGAVLLLILFLLKLARRLGYFTPRHGGQSLLKVRASCSVGHRERIVLVEAGEHWLVLGVTPGRITHLYTLPAGDEAPDEPPPAFSTLFARRQQSRETT